jgi:long-chain acyl-CoA synthetase
MPDPYATSTRSHGGRPGWPYPALPPELAAAFDELTAPGAPFEWAPVDVGGVTVRSYLHLPAGLRALFESTEAHGDTVALVYEDDRISYARLHDRVRRLASALRDRYGVGPGDRVALALRNLPEWVEGFWATTATGSVAVALNAWWVGPELEYGLTDSGARVLVCDAERLERILPHLERIRAAQDLAVVAVRVDEPPPGVERYEDLLAAAGPGAGLPPAGVGLDDDATIFYTSGTTGFPKGAVGTHRNLLTNLANLGFWAQATALAAEKRGLAPHGTGRTEAGAEPPAMLMTVPLFHVTGCHSIMVPVLAAGGKLVLMHRWDPERALELIERERITGFTGVPSMAWDLVNSPDFALRDTTSLRSVGGGGAPAPPELVRRVDRSFANAAPSVGYGLTETSSVTTLNGGVWYLERPDSVGVAMPVVELRVVADDGTDVAPGELGELWIKGPNVIRGYHGMPEATAEAITDGWLHSGDIARIDGEGFVYIVDRKKDVVIRGGENVYCAEVEAAVYEYPGVADAAVLGVPHERLGEEVGLVVRPEPGTDLDVEDLRAFLAGRLARFKVPAHIWVRPDELPRNPAGKILKRQLRQELVGA